MAADDRSSVVHVFKQGVTVCPIPWVVELSGEKWAFLIIRGAFTGLKHFEEFHGGLGIARNILSDRLGKLVAGGILKRAADPSDGRKVTYTLTAKGEDLLPVLVSLRQWGEEWGPDLPKVMLADKRDSRPVKKLSLQSHDGRELERQDLIYIDTGGDKVSRKSFAIR